MLGNIHCSKFLSEVKAKHKSGNQIREKGLETVLILMSFMARFLRDWASKAIPYACFGDEVLWPGRVVF